MLKCTLLAEAWEDTEDERMHAELKTPDGRFEWGFDIDLGPWGDNNHLLLLDGAIVSPEVTTRSISYKECACGESCPCKGVSEATISLATSERDEGVPGFEFEVHIDCESESAVLAEVNPDDREKFLQVFGALFKE